MLTDMASLSCEALMPRTMRRDHPGTTAGGLRRTAVSDAQAREAGGGGWTAVRGRVTASLKAPAAAIRSPLDS